MLRAVMEEKHRDASFDIAKGVGYEDSLYFSKVFKKVIGISPKEYARLSLLCQESIEYT